MSSDEKNSKPVPYKPNLPDLSPPASEELADMLMRLTLKNRKKTAEFENLVEAPKRIQ